ncbi:Rrf2 family transcriptional regulator [Limosilactobacillus sp. STM2_1]|uniref:Rrf2 family transcriptional regulator n=1 Tax=Limosilactobacillus rudii TaxID=2759755 RepID=A0A7W3ULG6_9LACO|nr:Rrf2 family transcriptional regulator [Limosilactobacillus rudii]MBB1079781.1 Rrf2 family transcriptional regulator [Limosilactobacillus rudii]MBB1097759.1 Rrf2 family transcriptional regulator [Limosilactobacillus rudii]MCD7134840.1 Rrf2 family transcriptional regulator [Limosilactobacillus rudii]
MRHSHKLSDAIHILTYIEICKNSDLSSKAIADSIEANASVVRNLMATLKRAGLLISHPGVAKAALSRPATQITLLDVYKAVDNDEKLIHIDPQTNPKCIVGAHIQGTLTEAYQQVQSAAEVEMGNITLQQIIDGVLDDEKRNPVTP